MIELIGPGNSFAEAFMFTGKPYMVNAQALTDTLLLSVGKQAVLEEIARDSRFALRMLAGISRRLHGLVHDVQAYALHSGLQRVIGYLLRDHAENDSAAMTVSLPVSKATIASRLSLTPEYFSRVLHELEAQRPDRDRQAGDPHPRCRAARRLPAGLSVARRATPAAATRSHRLASVRGALRAVDLVPDVVLADRLAHR